MPPPRHNVSGAMFDVKPVATPGKVNVAKLQNISRRVNLRPAAVKTAIYKKQAAQKNDISPKQKRTLLLQQLEASLSVAYDHKKVLHRIGIQVKGYTPPIQIANAFLRSPQRPRIPESSGPKAQILSIRTRSAFPKKKLAIGFITLAIVGFGAHYALGLKDRVIEEGETAVHTLEDAKDNLANLDFAAASENFLSAYEEFSKTGRKLNALGISFSSLLADLPGGEKLKSAQSLVEVGKLVADTGQSMSDAMLALSRAGLLLNPQGSSQLLLSQMIQPLNSALTTADSNLKKISVLLTQIDPEIIPADKRDMFDELQAQFPELQELVTQGSAFSDFLQSLIGVRGTKRYLVLFQNTSELRPTGGFPGSYAVFTFEQGKLKEYSVGDVYDIDGQIKELIIPPQQLQHITPTWALRDANWFIDFPTSAKKISEFFKLETGQSIDGVLTISPAIFENILKIIGPVEMPAYRLTITHDNFLATIQNEVEYGPNKHVNKPKKIIMDMAPVVMEKLVAADRNAWLEIFNVFIAGLEHKDMLMYFRDVKLQNFALENGFAGQVQQTTSDYLMVTATNVKGSKTDVVTDTVVKFGTYLYDGEITHKLVIGRTNNGGKSQYGFYNKQNPSYIRVLVPKGAVLKGITGHSVPAFNPLVVYDAQFKKDEDLSRFENSFRTVDADVEMYEESGKTGFAFWMIIDPGQTRTVELEYTVPVSVAVSNYELYVQKQPGLEIRNFNFEVGKPDSIMIANSMPTLNKIGNLYSFSGKLEKDLLVHIDFK